MNERFVSRSIVLSLMVSLAALSAFAQATQPAKPFEPTVGQEGKDVVWVPTPQVLVEKMLDMAKVTPQDFVMDLGSGDGRTVITAAKRGARAMGIEYNPDMVELSRKNAAAAKVSDKATFEKADLFETDLSKAQVITMFLLPSINMKLRPDDSRSQAGYPHRHQLVHDGGLAGRSVGDGDRGLQQLVHRASVDRAGKVEGTWQMPQGNLDAEAAVPDDFWDAGIDGITEGRLRGDQIEFTVGSTKYTGRVDGQTIRGTSADGKPWTATKH